MCPHLGKPLILDIFSSSLIQIDSCCKLSGMPDLSLSFVNSRLLEDPSFHPCVRLKRWEVSLHFNKHELLYMYKSSAQRRMQWTIYVLNPHLFWVIFMQCTAQWKVILHSHLALWCALFEVVWRRPFLPNHVTLHSQLVLWRVLYEVVWWQLKMSREGLNL